MTAGSKLELTHDESGYRHYLDGRAVRAGDALEMRSGDAWTPGRYEWSYNTDSLPYLVTDTDADEAVTIEAESLLRWPN
jgi:hypothetical protein